MAFLALSTAFLGFMAGQSGRRPTQQQPQQQVHTVTRHQSASQRRSDWVDRMGHPWLSWRCRPRSWGSWRASQDTGLHSNSNRNNKCTQSLDTSPHRSGVAMGWTGWGIHGFLGVVDRVLGVHGGTVRTQAYTATATATTSAHSH